VASDRLDSLTVQLWASEQAMQIFVRDLLLSLRYHSAGLLGGNKFALDLPNLSRGRLEDAGW
jgi:hypothetical protein